MKNDHSHLTAAHTLTFDQLREGYASWSVSGQLPDFILSYNDHEVMIRGFLYSAGDDRWILASEPDLKSCCVGASGKRGLQLSISGSLPKKPPSTALLVQGTLKVTPGTLSPFYALDQASILSEPVSLTLLWMIALACVCCLSIKHLMRNKAY